MGAGSLSAPPYEAFAREVRACRLCHGRYFDHDPRPVFQVDPAARLLLVGQAPGRRVHATGQPFNDVSGDNLREWLGVTREQFYNPKFLAILPAALCYPGTDPGKGDLPPPPICAPTWHPRFQHYLRPEVTLLAGRYAQAYYLETRESVSAVVARWRKLLQQGYFPLPHPSPRNRKWLRDRPWFFSECVPALREIVAAYLPAD